MTRSSQNPENGARPLSRQALAQALRGQIARLEGARRADRQEPVSSGCPPLDRLLPDAGFRRGTLVEWLADGEACGVQTLALGAAVATCREGGALVVLDHRRRFYPPSAARLGVELTNTIVVQALATADAAWALDQAVRCPAVAAVLAWPERLDGRAFRRLQLAAEAGGSLGLLIRPIAVRTEPSWAEVRLLVGPRPPVDGSTGRRLQIEVLRCRGTAGGGTVELEIDDETSAVHLVAPLAGGETSRRTSRA